MRNPITLLFFSFLIILPVIGNTTGNITGLDNRKVFINKNFDIDHFELIFQDSIGQIWGGSYDNGLMMFDGESFVKMTPSIGTYGIQCSLPINTFSYLLGTRNGLFLFDMETFETNPIPGINSSEISGLHRITPDKALVFCGERIVILDTGSFLTEDIMVWNRSRLIAQQPLTDGRFAILTDMDGAFIYNPSDNSVKTIELEGFSFRNERLLCLLYDSRFLWIGGDKGVIKYDMELAKTTRIQELENKVIKTFMLEEDGSVWVGTSDGLYIYHPAIDEWEFYFHDNKNERSIISNCIWCFHKDTEGNIWVGVDGGVSFIPANRSVVKIKWSDLIDTNQGNRITNILHDSRGCYWLGGVNGLGYYEPLTGDSHFFNMKNRVRTIYEDSKGIVWIGTDIGLAWFDRKINNFVICPVEEPVSGRSTVWTYGISEDNSGNFWIATCSGGIFCVSRDDLLGHKEGTISPIINYHSDSGEFPIPGSACMGIVTDLLDNVWVNADNWLYKIDPDGGLFSYSVQTRPALPGQNIRALLCDREGYIWGSTPYTIFRLHPETNEIFNISMDIYIKEYGEINSIIECEENIWFLTSTSAGIINKETFAVTNVINHTDSQYKSCYYDIQQKRIWLGGVDQCLLLDPIKVLTYRKEINPGAILSTLYVNGKSLSPLEKISGRNIAYSNRINLKPEENSLVFRISSGALPQDSEIQTGYYYRMVGVDNTWYSINPQNPLISYSYLRYGKYRFEIGKGSGQHITDVIRVVDIKIKTPWYNTMWFKGLLVLTGIILCLTWLNYYRVRTKLYISEMEKEKTLKLSQMKIEFLTDMSHELKTPLSLILGPVNNLLSTTKSPHSRLLLQTIQKSALRLNKQIHQIVNIQDAEPELEVTPSTVEIIEFVKCITNIYREGFQSKGINLTFSSDIEYLETEVDSVKMELVVNNLLSNALKFTPTGKDVSVYMGYDPALCELKIKVKDSGVGISPKDLPYIFDRFFQAEEHLSINKDGSGVGLSVVKNYVQQHGGTIQVSSSQEGTQFTIILPVKREREEMNAADIRKNMTQAEDELPSPHVLIVEDNIEIATFIADNLKGMKCTIVHNGKSGLEMARNILPDIIIADIMMPVMDGLQMSRILKRNISTSTIPILILTAKDNKLTELDAYKTGVDAFLPKPFDIDMLRARLHGLLRNKAKVVNKVQETKTESVELVLTTPNRDEKFMAYLTTTIEQNLEDPNLNVQKLAELTGYTTKQLYRHIKLLTGKTAVDFIKSIRLKKAALLLSQKQFTVAEVMYMIGFTTHSYFSKCFTEKYGKSPGRFREDGG